MIPLLLNLWKQKGVEVLGVEADKLRLKIVKGALTADLRSEIEDKKAEVIRHLSIGDNHGITAATDVQLDPQSLAYREYKMPDGRILRLTKEEFEDIVDVFRTLNSWRNHRAG